MVEVTVVGGGLAGLSAALCLAKHRIRVRLLARQPSERAQSVMAEGGINGALNTMGEDDSCEEHFADTMRAGGYLAEEAAVRGLTEAAPDIIRELWERGVPFQRREGHILLRSFGGQKKKRTAYARSSTGKAIMTALIDEARRYEAEGYIIRYSHHRLLSLSFYGEETGRRDSGELRVGLSSGWKEAFDTRRCRGLFACDEWTGEVLFFRGRVILCYGGMNGLFPSLCTGSVANDADAAARVFSQGILFSNLEMIQYHPTTIAIAGKRCLVSEAARGEGGRLFTEKGGERRYFMEEAYPDLGNLMPRDVVSREIHRILEENAPDGQVYLDMTGLSESIWRERLPDLRREIEDYLFLDPKNKPIPVAPAIHYFMGGIHVDVRHRSSVSGLYAAGECCSQYHGANRLGGNSMLGAIYGGRVAARTLMEEQAKSQKEEEEENRETKEALLSSEEGRRVRKDKESKDRGRESLLWQSRLRDILPQALGIVRSRRAMERALADLDRLLTAYPDEAGYLLSKAMVLSAMARTESLGAHFCLEEGELMKTERKKEEGVTLSLYSRRQ